MDNGWARPCMISSPTTNRVRLSSLLKTTACKGTRKLLMPVMTVPDVGFYFGLTFPLKHRVFRGSLVSHNLGTTDLSSLSQQEHFGKCQKVVALLKRTAKCWTLFKSTPSLFTITTRNSFKSTHSVGIVPVPQFGKVHGKWNNKENLKRSE